jgi:hypothetical protein
VRVGRSGDKTLSLKLDQAARASAEAIRGTGNEALGVARFLVRLGDALQTAPGALQSSPVVSPVSPSRHQVKPRGFSNGSK